MDKPSSIPTVVTHAGDFHVDELVAIALLKQFAFPSQSVSIVRSRATNVIEAAQQDSAVFVVDVGGQFSATRKNFDHHQESMTLGWSDGTPYSSCGLVWKWLRDKGFLSTLNDEECDLVEQEMIRPIDAHDSGVARWPLAPMFRIYNRPGGNDEEANRQFHRALDVAQDMVINQCHQATLDIRAKQVMREAWDDCIANDENGVVIVHTQLANRRAHSVLAEVSGYQANFMLYPKSPSPKNRHWFIRALPEDALSSVNRVRWPIAWSGKNNVDIPLSDGSSAKLVFSHKTGFLGQIEGRLEDAFKVAMELMAHPENKLRRQPASSPRVSM